MLVTAFYFFVLFTFHILASETKDNHILPLEDDSLRTSSRANIAQPNLKGLSIVGKNVERTLENDYRPNSKNIGIIRPQRLKWENSQAEIQRNYHHRNMNRYNEAIQDLEKSKKTTLGRVKTKLPILSHKLKQKEDNLRENAMFHKQEREKHRQTMRDVASDAQVHQKQGNFIDHDVKYVTQVNLHDSHLLVFKVMVVTLHRFQTLQLAHHDLVKKNLSRAAQVFHVVHQSIYE